MKDLLIKYLDKSALSRLTKEELLDMVALYQERDSMLMDKIKTRYESKRILEKKHEAAIALYQNKIDELFVQLAELSVKIQEYQQKSDIKLGNSYNSDANWIDKIVFVLKIAEKPLRSAEIIDILWENDDRLRHFSDPQKGLSAHLTRAVKYGRIKAVKQIGRNGYVYSLPKTDQ